MNIRRNGWVVAVALLVAGLACNAQSGQNTPAATKTPASGSGANKPSIAISSPASGAQITVGQTLQVQSLSTDAIGVTRVEMQVNGVVVRSDTAPDPHGQRTLALLQNWQPTQPGSVTITVIAYRADGTASDPASVTVMVVAASLSPSPSPTVGPCSVQTTTDVNIRSGPGTLYPILGVMGIGKTALVTGRNVDSTWWQIAYSGGSDGKGWLAAQFSTISGDCSKVSVANAPPPPPSKTPTRTPTSTATVTSTSTPSITLTMTPPDLVVTLIDMPVNLFLLGGKAPTNINVTVKNSGGQVAGGFKVIVYPVGKAGGALPVELGIVASLDPAELLTLSVLIEYTAAGVYTVEAVVDPDNKVTESDEGNNIRTLTVQVSAPPSTTP